MNELHNAIINIPCKRKDDEFINTEQRMLYKTGHRDARHAAAELVLQAIPVQVTQPNYPLTEYQPGQWWLVELEKHWGHGEISNDTKRAAKVACDFANAVFAERVASFTGAEGAQQQTQAWINNVVRDIAELPDRDSPEGQPDMMLVTVNELHDIIQRHTPTESAAAPAERLDEALANFLAAHTRLNQDGIDDYAMKLSLDLNRIAVNPVPEAQFAEWREQGYLATHQPSAQPVPALARCAASRDGECSHRQCPQLRDGEPRKSGRHCPLDINPEEA